MLYRRISGQRRTATISPARNVWVSGLTVPTGTPGRLLEAVRRGELVAVVSWDLTDADIDDVVAVLGPLLPDVDVAVEVRDPDDAAVVGAALAGGADAIVTGDRDLLDDADLRAWLAARRVDLLTPAALLARLGSGES